MKTKLRNTDLRLYRLTPKDKDGIFGRLHVPEERLDSQRIVHKFDTLERPYKGNQRNVSSIPLGVYRLRKKVSGPDFYEKYNERWNHRFVVEVMGVPNRSAILFHTGNFVNDSAGCILIGQRVRRPGTKMIENSRRRYCLFYSLMDKLWREVETKYAKEDRSIVLEVLEGKDDS